MSNNLDNVKNVNEAAPATVALKKIAVRKAGPVRLTAVAHPMYGYCGNKP